VVRDLVPLRPSIGVEIHGGCDRISHNSAGCASGYHPISQLGS